MLNTCLYYCLRIIIRHLRRGQHGSGAFRFVSDYRSVISSCFYSTLSFHVRRFSLICRQMSEKSEKLSKTPITKIVCKPPAPGLRLYTTRKRAQTHTRTYKRAPAHTHTHTPLRTCTHAHHHTNLSILSEGCLTYRVTFEDR